VTSDQLDLGAFNQADLQARRQPLAIGMSLLLSSIYTNFSASSPISLSSGFHIAAITQLVEFRLPMPTEL
jgi:hypothetical protein